MNFKEKKDLIELEKKAKIEVEKIRHFNRIKEIEEEKQAKLETMRIKTAEIRKHTERKASLDFMREYPKN